MASANFSISSVITIPGASTSNRSTGWTDRGTEVSTGTVPRWLEYSVDFGVGDSRTFSVTAVNRNSSSAPNLPTGYSYNLSVQVDGASKGTLLVPGSTTLYKTGSLVVTRACWDAYRSVHLDQ